MLKPDAISPGEHIYTGLSDVEEREASPSLEGWATFEAKSIRQSMDEIEPVKGWDAASVDSAISVEPKPFHRWVSTLRRRKLEEPATVTPRAQRWTLDDFDALPQSPPFTRPSQHQKSNSWASSFGFVATVRSATATTAAASIASVSRRTSRAQRHRHNSSAFSGSQPRPSCDTERSLMDEAARQRACRRREKVEELIRTEEGYVADLKALSNALFTLYSSLPRSQAYMQSCASTTLSQLIAVHHSLLDDLRKAAPFADNNSLASRLRRRSRWHSTDGSPSTSLARVPPRRERLSFHLRRLSSDFGGGSMLCSPQILLNLAAVISEHVPAFSAYDEFSKHYEMLRYGIDEAQRTMNDWSEYDTAFETLAHALNPVESRDANKRKALTVKDLLIKPVQRLPRYLLLFGDLRKLTPASDDQAAHEALGAAIDALEVVCAHINESLQSLDKKRTFDITWVLSERLRFDRQLPRSAFLRLLGQVTLCGCLHAAYRTKDAIKGRYAICVLFESTLLLACADEDNYRYSVLAGVALANATIAEADNGRGIQCHTAPHSWKVVYEHQTKMYEILFTACSAAEAEVWRDKITSNSSQQAKIASETHAGSFELFSPMVEEMRSIGKAAGKAHSVVMRMSQESIRRAATVASTSNLSQVIIKNTQACKEALDTNTRATLQIPRSQSVATPSHVQTLAPRRAERIRLEALLNDAWTKDLLPYPGMTPRRADPLRTGANHVMRKLSMASIVSNFSGSKRNASYTSMASGSRKEDMPAACARPRRNTARERTAPVSRPPLVDFHNAPEAFLPEDFDLGCKTARKRSALRTFTMTLERPFSPAEKPALLRRAQSVKDAAAAAAAGGSQAPQYTVVQARTITPGPTQGMGESGLAVEAGQLLMKTPRKTKSKNKLLRLFA